MVYGACLGFERNNARVVGFRNYALDLTLASNSFNVSGFFFFSHSVCSGTTQTGTSEEDYAERLAISPITSISEPSTATIQIRLQQYA